MLTIQYLESKGILQIFLTCKFKCLINQLEKLEAAKAA